VLRHLYVVKGRTPEEIAQMFKPATAEAVRYQLRQFGLLDVRRKLSFLEAIAAKGFRSREDFFKANADRSFVDLARDLGLTPGAISYQHDLYLKEKMLRAAR